MKEPIMKAPKLASVTQVARRVRALVRDDHGTSMITTAITLPLLITIFLGIFWVALFMFSRWMLRQGTNEAAQYISEQSRYWNINPAASGDVFPADWYDLEAHRIIGSRLRDILPYSLQQISDTLTVTVTEPTIAMSIEKDLCVPGDRMPGDYRPFDETGFMVQARWAVPFWSVRLPFDFKGWRRTLVFHERTVGQMQCPRWTGKGQAEDKSRIYGGKGPAIGYAKVPGPLPSRAPPTVTALPTVTPPPTVTPTFTPVPTVTPTITLTPP